MTGLQSVNENLALIQPDPLASRFNIITPNTVAPAAPALKLYVVENQQVALDEFDQETRAFMRRQGNILLQNNDFKLAQVVARRILELDAYDLGGLELLCDALLGIGNVEQASISARERLKALADATGHLYQAKIQYHLNQDKEAQRSLANALELVEQECDILFEIYKLSGNASLRQGDIDGAEEFYHRAYRLQPQSDLVLVNLGTLEIQRQSWSAARMRFQDAIGMNPKNEKGWIGLAIVHREQGDIELAWGNLERAIDIKIDNLTALQLCVTWGLADGFWQRAAIHLENYLGVKSEDADIAYSLSCLYFQMRRLRDADLMLERVRLLKPDREGVRDLGVLIQDALKREYAL